MEALGYSLKENYYARSCPTMDRYFLFCFHLHNTYATLSVYDITNFSIGKPKLLSENPDSSYQDPKLFAQIRLHWERFVVTHYHEQGFQLHIFYRQGYWVHLHLDDIIILFLWFLLVFIVIFLFPLLLRFWWTSISAGMLKGQLLQTRTGYQLKLH